jgi:hypothetical protein
MAAWFNSSHEGVIDALSRDSRSQHAVPSVTTLPFLCPGESIDDVKDRGKGDLSMFFTRRIV